MLGQGWSSWNIKKKYVIEMETCDNNGINKRNRMRYNLTIILEIQCTGHFAVEISLLEGTISQL